MSKLEDHPTVVKFRTQPIDAPPNRARPLDAQWLKQLCLDAGADDVGLVSIDRPELDGERPEIHALFPWCRSLVSFVVRMNREPIRSPARSISNAEFHRAGKFVEDVAGRIARTLEDHGLQAMNTAHGFPMEADRFPGKVWVVSHKPIAVAAGLGQMGIHRNVIHPRFGNFILLGTILLASPVSADNGPISYNPCLDCKLCVAACPVGAIASDGAFNFAACATHNYREFLGGFTDWVEGVADSRDRFDYRNRFTDAESVSMWQSLSFGANYKAAYCLAVCPAGEDVIGPFLADRPAHLREIVRPLQEKIETIYVTPSTDAEDYVPRRFPQKRIKRVGRIFRPRTVQSFLIGLPLVFQRGRAGGLRATYHFRFTGKESREATVAIADGKLTATEGLHDAADLTVTADTETWFGFLAGERSIVWALVTRKVKLRGPLRLLRAFGRCFPG